jgi:GTPase SAR1 family protein
MSLPSKEFHLCVMGASNVGKTGLCERLIGKAFARKPARPSIEDEATRYSIEVQTSVGLLLIHLYDWAWEVKRRDVSINQQIMRGNDG